MASSEYHHQQAKILLSMALAASDPEVVERLRLQAEVHLALAATPNGTEADFNFAVDGYNERQLRGD